MHHIMSHEALNNNPALEPAELKKIIDVTTRLAFRKYSLYEKFELSSGKDYSAQIEATEKEVDEQFRKHPEYGEYGGKLTLEEKIKSIPIEPAYTEKDFLTAEQKKATKRN